jgi:hypothetical protein
MRALRLDYKGLATNAVHGFQDGQQCEGDHDRMYVEIEDTAGHVAVYLNPDANAQLTGNWTSWYVALTDINDINHGKDSSGNPATVDLNSINGFSIGFGLRGNTLDTDGVDVNSVVLFDNIRLYAATCVSQYGPTADLDGDCDVDLNDMTILAGSWLAHADNFVFNPCTAPAKAPIVWYKFDNAGTVSDQNTYTADSGTGDANNYVGTINAFLSQNWKHGVGRHNDTCLYLPPGAGCYVNLPIGPTPATPHALGFLTDASHAPPGGGGMSFSIWINADMTSNLQTSWNGLISIWTGTPQSEILELECPFPWVPANNYSPGCNFVRKTPSGVTTIGTGRLPNDNFGGRWNHWAFVKDSNSMQIYVNGNLTARRDSNTLSGDPNIGVYGPFCVDSNVTVFRIGTRGGNWGQWSGYMQDFQLYDYALSAGEVAYLATDGVGHVFLPLVSPANINTDGSTSPMTDVNQIVNFGDIAIMEKQWHTQILWP